MSAIQKSMFLFLLCSGFSYVACAQKAPPAAIVTAFNQKFQQVQDLDWLYDAGGKLLSQEKYSGNPISTCHP